MLPPAMACQSRVPRSRTAPLLPRELPCEMQALSTSLEGLWGRWAVVWGCPCSLSESNQSRRSWKTPPLIVTADPWLFMGEPLSFRPSPKVWSVSCHPCLEREELHSQNWHWVPKPLHDDVQPNGMCYVASKFPSASQGATCSAWTLLPLGTQSTYI